MKRFVRKWFSLVCLCLVLLGLPVLLGACGFDGKIDMGTPAPVGTSSRNPYVIVASPGACTVWSITLDTVGGKAWCASFLPTQQVGAYVRLSFGVLSQDFRITSVDTSRHIVSLGGY